MGDLDDLIVSEGAVGTGETETTPGAPPPAATVEAAKQWMQQAPDDLKKNVLLAAFEGVGPLCKGYVDLHGELTGLKKSMEVPDGADGYKFGDPKLPEGLPVDKDLESAFKQICIEKKIGLEQAKSLFEFYNTYLATRYNTVLKRRSNADAETERQLKGEWGEEGYNAKTTLIGKLVAEKAGDDAARVMEVFDKAALYGDPATLKFLAAVAADYGEHKLVEGETPGIKGSEEEEPAAQPGEPAKSVRYKKEFREFAGQK